MSLSDVMAERERLSAARSGHASPRRGESAPLPSAPIPNTLPVLRPGVDWFPDACTHCGGRLLSSEPPLASNRYGLLSCAGCGTELAWLSQPLPPVAPRRAPMPAAPPPPAATPASAPEWRLPGCAVACRRNQHDPISHEQYGRHLARAEVEAQLDRPREPFRTGCLTIDLTARRVLVDGTDPRLTPTEHSILLYLAANVDRPCRHADIVRAVWDEIAVEIAAKPRPGRKTWHVIVANIARLRKKLGPAAPLLETLQGIGYRLRFVEP